MFERFTEAARGAVVSARDAAHDLGSAEIGAEHLLLGAMTDQQGVPARILRQLGVERSAVEAQARSFGSPDSEALKTIGVDLDAVRRRAEETFGPGALDRPRRQRAGLFGHRSVGGGHLPFTAEAKKTLGAALREALVLGHGFIGTEHLLLGLIGTDQDTAWLLLRQLGLTADRQAVRSLVLAEITRAA
jgi:ATP-dependent Clp protease ATP-binding subunit ClpA